MNKKELAEQILMKHIGEIDWPEFKEFGFLRKATAAIIEAMGEKPDSEKDKSIIEAARHHAQVQWGDPAKFISQNEADCYKYAVSDFIEGALWASNRVEAMGVQPNLLNNKQNVQVSDTTDDAQRYTAD